MNLDGAKRNFSSKAVGPTALFLNWTPLGVLLLNFQVDGASPNSGTMQGYFGDLQIYRW